MPRAGVSVSVVDLDRSSPWEFWEPSRDVTSGSGGGRTPMSIICGFRRGKFEMIFADSSGSSSFPSSWSFDGIGEKTTDLCLGVDTWIPIDAAVHAGTHQFVAAICIHL